MMSQLDPKELERKAFRSTYQDGLWDVYLGLIVICMAFFLSRPEEGYGARNILLLMVSYGLTYALFWVGKKFITLPRMGQVTFGPIRKQKKSMLALILGLIVAMQAGIVLLSIVSWCVPRIEANINSFINVGSLKPLTVAALSALFVSLGMILIAHFNDLPRGYYIAILMSLAVFLMIWMNQPVFPIIIGALIALPGLALFVRFLKKYPLNRKDAGHE